MSRVSPLDITKRLEHMEMELTKLNAKRSLSEVERRLEIAELGNCLLLKDTAHPQSPYYNRVKGYFHASQFHNYMLTIDGRPAAMGSLFLHGSEGYLANDYTFEEFQGRGCQTALIGHRLSAAAELGLENVYTDVEFGSVSHTNMEKAGFRTAFINTFWMHG